MSKTTERKFPTMKSLIEDSPWEIAKKFGVHYSGDLCPVPHGGYWYETNHWQGHGYATAIQISESDGVLWVEERTINKPDSMTESLAFYGFRVSPEDSTRVVTDSGDEFELTPSVEIEACMAYGSENQRCRLFDSDNGKDWGNFPERKIMKAVQEFWPCLMSE